MEMTFNLSKSEFLRITKKLNPILMQYYIRNDVIKEVKHAKYLGVIMNILITLLAIGVGDILVIS